LPRGYIREVTTEADLPDYFWGCIGTLLRPLMMDLLHHKTGRVALVLVLVLAASAAAQEDIPVEPTANQGADGVAVDLQGSLAQFGNAEATRINRIPFDCDVRQPTPVDVAAAQAAERAMYGGRTVADLTGDEVAVAAAATGYTLVNIPVRFHLLRNAVVTTTRVNQAMLRHMVDALNEDYAGFATFVYNGTVVQTRTNTCDNLSPADYDALINARGEVQTTYKLHAIICELAEYSGIASFPTDYSTSDTRHNAVRIDYRAVACRNRTTGAVLNTCNPKWWRTRSMVISHEFGHIFGLFHTFTDGCATGNDGISDTAAEAAPEFLKTCPGIVSSSVGCSCSGSGGCMPGCNSCGFKTSAGAFMLAAACPARCCATAAPLDSCTGTGYTGTDPVLNFMSYSPDYCSIKGNRLASDPLGTSSAGFTNAQFLKMAAQIKSYKRKIYCRYQVGQTRCTA